MAEKEKKPRKGFSKSDARSALGFAVFTQLLAIVPTVAAGSCVDPSWHYGLAILALMLAVSAILLAGIRHQFFPKGD